MANAVVDENGGVRALDARTLYCHAPAAAALARAAVRWELRGLGCWRRRRSNGVWEIEGVDDEVIQELTQRWAEMDEVRSALELLSDARSRTARKITSR